MSKLYTIKKLEWIKHGKWNYYANIYKLIYFPRSDLGVTIMVNGHNRAVMDTGEEAKEWCQEDFDSKALWYLDPSPVVTQHDITKINEEVKKEMEPVRKFFEAGKNFPNDTKYG